MSQLQTSSNIKIIGSQYKSPVKKKNNNMTIQSLNGGEFLSSMKKNPYSSIKNKDKKVSFITSPTKEPKNGGKVIISVKDEITELEDELSDKKAHLKEIVTAKLFDLENINEAIIARTKELEYQSKHNTFLINTISKVNNEFKTLYSKVNIQKILHKNEKIKKKNNEKIIQKKKAQIIIQKGNKAIDHLYNVIEMSQKQKKNLIRKINENTDDKKLDMEGDIKKYQYKKQELKDDIEELMKIKAEHEKICDKIINDLEHKYEILKKEYDYEIKKKELRIGIYKDNTAKVSQKIIFPEINMRFNKNTSETLSTNRLSCRNSIIFNNLSKSCNRQRNLEDDKQGNKKSIFNSINNDFTKSIKDIFSSINNKNNNTEKEVPLSEKRTTIIKKLNLNNIKLTNKSIELFNNDKRKYNNYNISLTTRDLTPSRQLFSDREKDILNQVLPEKFIDNYQKKFDNIEKERLIIEEKMKKNEDRRNIIQKLRDNFELNRNRQKGSELEGIKLRSKISEIKREMIGINIRIKNNQKTLRIVNKGYFEKNKENERIRDLFIKFYQDIQSKKIKLKEGKNLSQDDINAIEKWGGPSKFIISQDNNNKKNYLKKEDDEDNNDYEESEENNDEEESEENE